MPACGCASSGWATGIFVHLIYFIYYHLSFSVYQHFIYLFTTRHLHIQHKSVLACGCASLRLTTSIFAIYITQHTQNFIIFSSSDILCILTFLLFFHNLAFSEPALECASMWLCWLPVRWATSIFVIYIAWYYEIYFIYYLPAFSVYWNFYYLFTTRHLQNRHMSVPACGYAGCRQATSIFCHIYHLVLWDYYLLAFSVYQHFNYLFHNLAFAEPAPECAGMWPCQLPASYQHLLLYISPDIMRFNYLLSSGILCILTLLFFSQPGICKTGTKVCWHVAVPVAGELPSFFAIYITWYYEIYYFPAFSIYQHFNYFLHSLPFAEPAPDCSSMWLCQLPVSYQKFCYIYHPSYSEFPSFIIIWHFLYTGIFIIFSQPSIHRTGTLSTRPVPVYGCAGCQWATGIFAIYICLVLWDLFYLLFSNILCVLAF